MKSFWWLVIILFIGLVVVYICTKSPENYYVYFIEDNLNIPKTLMAHLNMLGESESKNPDVQRTITGKWWHNKTLPQPRHLDSPSNGLCFSGGGTVAMIYTAGFLRGLSQAKILNDKHIRHVAGSSGATWALTPCAYINAFKEVLNLNLILGTYTEPCDILMYQMINMAPRPFIGNCGTNGTLLKLVETAIMNFSPTSDIPAQQISYSAIAKVILEPLGMYYNFTLVQQEKEDALVVQAEVSKGFTDYNNVFYLRPEFPYPHFLTTAIDAPDVKTNMSISNTYRYPLEMTPSQMGCLSEDIEYNNIPIGGQITNFCFGGRDNQGEIPVGNNEEIVRTVVDNSYNIVGLKSI